MLLIHRFRNSMFELTDMQLLKRGPNSYQLNFTDSHHRI